MLLELNELMFVLKKCWIEAMEVETWKPMLLFCQS